MKVLGILFLVYCLTQQALLAQSQERCRWLRYTQESFQVDSLSILPNSFTIKNNAKPSLQVLYDINSNLLRFSEAFEDSILLCYQVLPFNLSQEKF